MYLFFSVNISVVIRFVVISFACSLLFFSRSLQRTVYLLTNAITAKQLTIQYIWMYHIVLVLLFYYFILNIVLYFLILTIPLFHTLTYTLFDSFLFLCFSFLFFFFSRFCVNILWTFAIILYFQLIHDFKHFVLCFFFSVIILVVVGVVGAGAGGVQSLQCASCVEKRDICIDRDMRVCVWEREKARDEKRIHVFTLTTSRYSIIKSIENVYSNIEHIQSLKHNINGLTKDIALNCCKHGTVMHSTQYYNLQ